MIFDCLQLVNFAVLDCLLCTHDFFSHRQARHFDERRTTFYHGKRLFVECHDEQQNLDLLFRNRIHVDFVKCILLEKAVLYHFCNGEDEAFGVRKRIRSDKAHNLLETLFALKEVECLESYGRAAWIKFIPPLLYIGGIFRVRLKPADCRIVACVRKLAVKRPEAAYEALCVLGDWFGEISSWR